MALEREAALGTEATLETEATEAEAWDCDEAEAPTLVPTTVAILILGVLTDPEDAVLGSEVKLLAATDAALPELVLRLVPETVEVWPEA
jgi:hypothetical protein